MSRASIDRGARQYSLWVVIPSLAAVLFLIVWGRVYYGSYQSYQEGMVHLENQSLIRAITYFDRSIHWYTPFNPWVSKSAERLWEIGEKAEQKGDTRLALIAYRTIRQGFYAARSVYQPRKDWIRRAEKRIAQLVHQESDAASSPLPSQNIQDPDVFWSIVVIFGLFGWIGSLLGFIMAYWGPWQERESWLGYKLPWVGAFFVFFLLWLSGMWLA